jgi:hypothetical protein
MYTKSGLCRPAGSGPTISMPGTSFGNVVSRRELSRGGLSSSAVKGSTALRRAETHVGPPGSRKPPTNCHDEQGASETASPSKRESAGPATPRLL